VKQRIVLWGAVGALALGAGALVAVSTLGDGDEPAALPLALAGSDAGGAADAATASAEALTIAPGPTTFVAGEGLPELGGEARAHRLPAEVDEGEVADLADALGIAGDPVEADGAWTVAGDELTLSVVPVTGTWSAYETYVPTPEPAPAPDTGGATSPGSPGDPGTAGDPGLGTDAGGGVSGAASGASGAEGESIGAPVPADEMAVASTPSTIVCITTPCEQPPIDEPVPCAGGNCPGAEAPEPCADPDCPVASPTDPVEPTGPADPAAPVDPCPPDPAVSCVPACAAAPAVGDTGDVVTDPACPPAEPVGPVEGLPTEDAARDSAVELLDAAGFPTDDADVEAFGGTYDWTVDVEPRVDGLLAPGLAGYVTVGPEGVIRSASGPLLPVEELDEYPLMTTAEAIDRLNTPGDMSIAGPGGPAVDVPAVAPETTIPADQPTSGAEPGTDVQGLRGQTTVPAGPPMTPGTAMPPDGFPTTTPGGPSASLPATTVAPGDPSAPTTGTSAVPPSAPTTGTLLPTEPGAPEPMPLPEPQPIEVELTDAELVLLAVASWDGSGTYLVPGYRFSTADGEGPTVPALPDDALEPPVDTATTEPPDSGSGSGSDAGLPEPAHEPVDPGLDVPEGAEPGTVEPAPPAAGREPAGAPSTVTITAVPPG